MTPSEISLYHKMVLYKFTYIQTKRKYHITPSVFLFIFFSRDKILLFSVEKHPIFHPPPAPTILSQFSPTPSLSSNPHLYPICTHTRTHTIHVYQSTNFGGNPRCSDSGGRGGRGGGGWSVGGGVRGGGWGVV